MAARAGFEPATLQTKSIESTNEPHKDGDRLFLASPPFISFTNLIFAGLSTVFAPPIILRSVSPVSAFHVSLSTCNFMTGVVS